MKYIAKKFITLILTLFLISILVFLIFQVIPGDPVLSILGTEATEEKIEALREELGLNASLPERYFDWLFGILKGDLGRSYRYKENLNEQMAVSRLVAGKLPVTLTLAGMSLILIIVLSKTVKSLILFPFKFISVIFFKSFINEISEKLLFGISNFCIEIFLFISSL